MRIIFSALLCILLSTSVIAQTTPATAPASDTTTKADNSSQNTASSGDETAKSVVRYSLLYGAIPITFLFGAKAWDWGGNHHASTAKEGWFDHNTALGGADKGGHFLAHYIVQRSLYQVFDWTESGGDKKWLYSMGTTMAVGLFIEVGDAFSSRYGFSYEDLIIDYSGILLGAALDYFPIADGFIGISGRWIPTKQYKDGFRNISTSERITRGLSFVDDYSGWTEMINFKLAGFERLGIHLPLFLRLIQFDIGFHTEGYCAYDRERWATPKRSRYIVYGISLNSAQLFEESWTGAKRGGLYTAGHKFLEFYHIPVEKAYSKKIDQEAN